MKQVYKTLHLFCGIGGGALGFQTAKEEYRGITGTFETLCGIDVDPEACKDFEAITGERAEQVDLFDRQQYIDFHGQEPPAEWQEITAKELRLIVGGVPDVVFTSPPCKGFSGLLPEKSAKTKKYQALNRLTIRSIKLTLEAFKDELPALILLENVPRITTRGKPLLNEIKQLLTKYGYIINDDSDQYHDCGEIGGLAQSRRRYLLIARNPMKLDSFVYQPPTYPLKNIGDVIGPLPLPGEKYGKIHELPKLQWKTWVRLALIPAGGDWRDLENIDWKNYRISHLPRAGCGHVGEWDKPSRTITGARGVGQSNSITAISDPRTGFKEQTHHTIYRVQKWDENSKTVTGAMRPNNGAPCISDPRLKQGSRYTNKWQIHKWDGKAATITGTQDIQSGAPSIGDPRIKCKPRAGTFGVLHWNQPAKTIIGSLDVHAGTSAVADPRIPEDYEQGIFIILAEDGTWHRPLTTFENAMIQGFPTTLANGNPFELSGNSDARWRERIGNAVPPAAARAIAETMLRSLLAHSKGDWLMAAESIWVVPTTLDIVELH